MSPEQLKSQHLDERSDLFSLGVVLYEALAGQPAFRGTSAGERIAAILSDDVAPLAAGGVPAEIDAVLSRAMARDRERRYRTASEFLADLRAVASGEFVAPLPDTLAVVDFENLSKNPDDAWIGSGIAESLAADLARVAGLSVVAREKVLSQRGRLGRGRARRRGGGARPTAAVPLGFDGRLSARGTANPRDVPADRGRDRGDGRERKGRWSPRRNFRHPGPARGRGRAEAPSRRGAAAAACAGPADRRLRAARARASPLPSAREGLARPGAPFLRAGDRGRSDACAVARGARVGPCDAVHLPDRSARARARVRIRAPRDRGRREPGGAPDLAGLRAVSRGQDRRGGRAGAAGDGARSDRRFRPLLRRVRPMRLRGDTTRRAPVFQRALEIEPRHGWALLGLGWTHLELGSAAEARWCLEKAVRARTSAVATHPTVGVAGLLGECLRRQGDLEGARARCLEGLESAESTDNMYRDTFRGVCLCALGRTALEQADTPRRGPRSLRPCRTCAAGRTRSAGATSSCRRWRGSPGREKAPSPSRRRFVCIGIARATTSRSCGAAPTG